MAHDAAAERDPLLLAARELAGFAAEQLVDAENVDRALDLLPYPALRHLPVAQPESEIVVDRHVLVEGVILEHHRDVAVPGRQLVDHPVADRDGPGRDLLESRDHPQRGRLAAARRADQDHELLVRDLQIDIAHRDHRAVGLADAGQGHLRHQTRNPRITYF